MNVRPDALRQIDREHQRVAELMNAHPDWSDRRIASYVWPRFKPGAPHNMDFWVATARHLRHGTLPPLTTHAEIVRWCFEVGVMRGWTVSPESSICIAPRCRMVPDVIVRREWGGPVSLVIEVKRSIDTRSELTHAIQQVARYVDWFAVRPKHDGVRGVILANRFSTPGAEEALQSFGLLMWTPTDYLGYVTSPTVEAAAA